MYSMCAVWCQAGVGWYKGAFPVHERKSDPPGCPRFHDLPSVRYLSTPELAPLVRTGSRRARGPRCHLQGVAGCVFPLLTFIALAFTRG